MAASCESHSRGASPTISSRSSRQDLLHTPSSASDLFAQNTVMSNDAHTSEVARFASMIDTLITPTDLSSLAPSFEPSLSDPSKHPSWLSSGTAIKSHAAAPYDGYGYTADDDTNGSTNAIGATKRFNMPSFPDILAKRHAAHAHNVFSAAPFDEFGHVRPAWAPFPATLQAALHDEPSVPRSRALLSRFLPRRRPPTPIAPSASPPAPDSSPAPASAQVSVVNTITIGDINQSGDGSSMNVASPSVSVAGMPSESDLDEWLDLLDDSPLRAESSAAHAPEPTPPAVSSGLCSPFDALLRNESGVDSSSPPHDAAQRARTPSPVSTSSSLLEDVRIVRRSSGRFQPDAYANIFLEMLVKAGCPRAFYHATIMRKEGHTLILAVQGKLVLAGMLVTLTRSARQARDYPDCMIPIASPHPPYLVVTAMVVFQHAANKGLERQLIETLTELSETWCHTPPRVIVACTSHTQRQTFLNYMVAPDKYAVGWAAPLHASVVDAILPYFPRSPRYNLRTDVLESDTRSILVFYPVSQVSADMQRALAHFPAFFKSPRNGRFLFVGFGIDDYRMNVDHDRFLAIYLVDDKMLMSVNTSSIHDYQALYHSIHNRLRATAHQSKNVHHISFPAPISGTRMEPIQPAHLQ